jgi:hypothetical protein
MMKKLVRSAVLWLSATAVFSCALVHSPAQTTAMRDAALTKEQWRQDLQHLAKELPRRHKNVFHTVSREAFERAVAEFDAALPTLQEPEIITRIQQILALTGDGHAFPTCGDGMDHPAVSETPKQPGAKQNFSRHPSTDRDPAWSSGGAGLRRKGDEGDL